MASLEELLVDSFVTLSRGAKLIALCRCGWLHQCTSRSAKLRAAARSCLVALAIKADGAIGAPLPAGDLDAEGGGELRGLRTGTTDSGAGR